MGKVGKIAELGSDAVALRVIERFKEEFLKNGESWSTNYKNKLRGYVLDSRKQERAKTKLVAYYDILEANKRKIEQIFNEIVDQYKNVLEGLKQKLPPITAR